MTSRRLDSSLSMFPGINRSEHFQELTNQNNVSRKVGQGESSSTCQSDDDDLSGDFLSDSNTSSDSDTDSDEQVLTNQNTL